MARRIRDYGGKWLDTSVFRASALRFKETGMYCEAPYGTMDWINFWKEELRRCVEGFEVRDSDGTMHKITGHYYAYLNYAVIQMVENVDEDEESDVRRKVTDFPDFWDGDYNFFWSLEIARNGIASKYSLVPGDDKDRREWLRLQKELKKLEHSVGDSDGYYLELKAKRDSISEKILGGLGLYVKPHLDYLSGGYHFLVGKSRRRGYSYKTAFICANIYNTIKNSLTVIGAYDKKYVDQTMSKTAEYMNFFNEHTGFSKNRLIDKQDYKKSGFTEVVNGLPIEKGYKSVVDATRTFKDNPDVLRGIDAHFILLEEAGAFDNLGDSYNATYPSLTAGSFMTGQICIIGTSGDLKKGTVDYADMFYNPLSYKIMPFVNIWDEGAEGTMCCFFHPASWNLEGFYDKQGNSDIAGATSWLMRERKRILDNSSSSLKLQKYVQEYPLCPADAFSQANSSIFPAVELRERLNKVMAHNLQVKKGTAVSIYEEDGMVKTKLDLQGKLQPIYNWKPKVDDLTGCPVIYEFPVANAPRGLYKIGYDPYRQDRGSSLASITVFKGFMRGSYLNNTIVAEYVGRPTEADDVNRLAMNLAKLYNAEIMVENEITHVVNYFRRHKSLNLLALQPDRVISANIRSSKVARVYGCHMNEKLKDAGEKYIKDWLLGVNNVDENGDKILNLDTINSIGLLEELVGYNRKDNFDRVSSLIMCMIQLQEEELGKEYGTNEKTSVSRVVDVLNSFYKNN